MSDMFEVVGEGHYNVADDTLVIHEVWAPTHRSEVSHCGSEARLIAPGWNSQGWGTLENENGDRWRDEREDWAVIVPNILH